LIELDNKLDLQKFHFYQNSINFMNKLPPARTNNIVMQDLGKEILLYDLTTSKVFCLNQTVSVVFRSCDGITDFAEFKSLNKDFSDELVFLTLDLLDKNNLLGDENFQVSFGHLSRREVVKKIGLASLVTLPIISSIVAPTSAMAASVGSACGGTLTTGANTGWHCNFGSFGGSAAFCNSIQCNTPQTKNLCISCSSSATLNPAPGPGFYDCICN
jgi:hypothetical protein